VDRCCNKVLIKACGSKISIRVYINVLITYKSVSVLINFGLRMFRLKKAIFLYKHKAETKLT